MRRVRINAEPDSPVWSNPSRIRARIRPVVLGILMCMLCGSAATAQRPSKNVLVLFSSFGRNTAWLDSVEPPIRARVPVPITFYEAYIEEGPEVENDSYRQSVAVAFRDRYAGKNLDLVITDGHQALDFAEHYRDQIFPGVPIVFTAITTSELDEDKKWPGVTGVADLPNLRETIDLVLRLQPDTKTFAVISGSSEWDRYWLAAAHSELLRHQDKVREIDLVGPPSRELLERVAALPPHTVTLFQIFPQDSSQSTVGLFDVLPAIAKSLPTYCTFPGLCFGHGGVGGVYHDASAQLARTEEMAAQVLLGARPEDIPIARQSDLQARVDWRALRRWHIPESGLPPGSVILYREPSFWERDRKYIIPAIALILAQALLIAGLLWQRARKRKAEAVLRESEERFRRMADTTPSLIWMCDAHGKVTYLNEQRLAFTGPDPDAGYGDTWITYIHPDDVKNVLDSLWEALKNQKPFSKEYRLHRSDGAYRWMFDVASPRVNGDGTFAGFIGSAIDVTDQKLAQRALQQMSGQLIEAQEKERTRIARDLHDDICQRLALLSMELEQAKRDTKGRVSATKNLEDIRQHCSEIAGDVQSLSHQLHSSKLDYLGIVAAIRGFCKEFSKQHGVTVEFNDGRVPRQLPKDISLCLFRVTQEALHNAGKYSKTDQFKVELTALTNGIQLAVTDAGVGFDVEEAKKNRGLGLVSMQERVHLVHGKFSIESQPGMGTRIVATVPLIAENGSSPNDAEAKEKTGALGIAS